jgi:uncharacterized small protein (DUF1192 family)
MAIQYASEKTGGKPSASLRQSVNSQTASGTSERELTQLRKRVAELQTEVGNLKALLAEKRGSHAEYMREYRKRRKGN